MAAEQAPSVNVLERLRDLLITEEIAYTDTLVYEFRGGYEVLTHDLDGGGSSEYRGVFHPNDGLCETGSGAHEGICKWCGRTLM